LPVALGAEFPADKLAGCQRNIIGVPAGFEKLTPPVSVAGSKDALKEPTLLVGSSSNAIVPGPYTDGLPETATVLSM
jgi:hypothetical protein